MCLNCTAKLKRRGYFPMHTAAGAGAVESLELLISAGFCPEARDEERRLPLHRAASRGRVECVSFLCVIAKRTIAVRSGTNGDTPLHCAVRSRSPACVEVLLLQGGSALAREMNLDRETPADVAESLGDAACLQVLRRGSRRRHRRSRAMVSGPSWDADLSGVQRIFAVWERFFENAAKACVALGTATSVGRAVRGYDPDVDAVARGSEVDRAAPIGQLHRRNTDDMRKSSADRYTCNTHRPGGGYFSGEFSALGERSRGLRISSAWEPHSPLPVMKEQDSSCTELENEGGPFPPWGREVRRAASTLSCVCESQVDNDAGWSSSLRQDKDARSEFGVQQEIQSRAEPTCFRIPWVACWDSDWETVYYVNPQTGNSSWCLPPEGVPPRVWDPESGAYFVVEEGGVSRWLGEDIDGGNAYPDDDWSSGALVNGEETENRCPLLPHEDPEYISTSCQTASVGVFRDGESGDCWWDALDVASGTGETCAIAGESPLMAPEPIVVREEDHAAAIFHGTLQPLDLVGTVERMNTPAYRDPSIEGLQPHLNSEELSHLDDREGFACVDDRERDRGVNTLVPRRHERRSARELGSEEEQIGAILRSDEYRFVVPGWVLWYARDGESPPYYVNEESGESSWELPSGVPGASRDWIRAWREGDRAEFYVNQWTWRVARTLADLGAPIR